MPTHRDCSGIQRRDFLRIGALGFGGLALPDLLRAEGSAPRPTPLPTTRHAESAIVVVLEGGPSHLDTFDPKPDAPAGVRGEFGVIPTSVPGVRLSEHLPRLAAGMGDYALLRGVAHTLSDHDLGRRYVLTGTKPLASLAYPEYAAVLSRLRPAPPETPSAVAVPRAAVGPGFLGPAYSSFETGSTPQPGQALALPGLSLAPTLPLDRLGRRDELLRRLDGAIGGIAEEEALEGMDRFSRQAYAMLRSPRTRDALDLSKESPRFARRFSPDPFSQSCLLAIRLVEAGVRCVTVTFGGWDTHTDLFPTLRDRLLPQLDAGLASLFAGLREKGLTRSTAVLVTGEFGRTPEINDRGPRPGREHYARCMFVLMSGGRIEGGRVIGASDERGSAPANEGMSPDDVAATFYANLGIDPRTEFTTPDGRPVALVRGGIVSKEILG